jgi:prepilin-type N-terminal cleavage/methylation domain-containing protein
MARKGAKVKTGTLRTGTPRGSRSWGFTLLELLVVLLIVALFSALYSVRIEGVLSGGDLRLASRVIMGEISKMRGKAAYTHRNHFMVFNLDENTLTAFSTRDSSRGSSEGKVEAEDESFSTLVKLPKGVDLEDVVIYQKGKVQQGKVNYTFFANGTVERALIHLRNQKDEAYTLEINPLTGQVTVHDSYIDQQEIL